MRLFVLCLTVLFFDVSLVYGKTHAEIQNTLVFSSEEELDLYCLKKSYPDIKGTKIGLDGATYLLISNELGSREVLYAKKRPTAVLPEYHVTDVRTSMLPTYPLEPSRPVLPEKFSPGRWRSMELIAALYGDSNANVRKNLKTTLLQGQKIALSREAASALENVEREIARAVREDESLAKFLRAEGGAGYIWRKVAGENYMSPHAYGIALDLSPKLATYWRWSKLRPHPLQKSYPPTIVKAFEDNGFIWGGKWYEYDMMHFEYRPELVCKAKLKGFVLPTLKDKPVNVGK